MRRRVFIDIDGTLFNSTLIVTSFLNDKYNKIVDWKTVKRYDFRDAFPEVTKKDIIDAFNSEKFFELAEHVIYRDCQCVIKRLSKDFEVNILSIGTAENISRKLTFLSKHFPMINKYIMIVKNDGIMDKSIINMKKSDIIIDDVYSNLETSTAGTKILFSYLGIETMWNNYGSMIDLTTEWEDVERRIYDNI